MMLRPPLIREADHGSLGAFFTLNNAIRIARISAVAFVML
jgi:hypothetical protein